MSRANLYAPIFRQTLVAAALAAFAPLAVAQMEDNSVLYWTGNGGTPTAPRNGEWNTVGNLWNTDINGSYSESQQTGDEVHFVNDGHFTNTITIGSRITVVGMKVTGNFHFAPGPDSVIPRIMGTDQWVQNGQYVTHPDHGLLTIDGTSTPTRVMLDVETYFPAGTRITGDSTVIFGDDQALGVWDSATQNDNDLFGEGHIGIDHAYATFAIPDGTSRVLENRVVVDRDATLKFAIGADSTLVLEGNFKTLKGDGDIIKTGSGTLALLGDNTEHHGKLHVAEGVLVVRNDNNLGDGDRTLAADTTLLLSGSSYNKGWRLLGDAIVNDYDHNVQMNGTFSGAGGLRKEGFGTLTLTGANTYTGPTTVDAGTLELASAGTLMSHELIIAGIGTFINSNGNHSLAGGALTVNGSDAHYVGDLNAEDAKLRFVSPGIPNIPMLNVTGDANLNNASLHFDLNSGGQLTNGLKLTLVRTGGTLSTNGLTIDHDALHASPTRHYDFILSQTGSELVATLTGVSLAPEDKVYSEGWLSNVLIINDASNLLANTALDNMVVASKHARGWTMFGGVAMKRARYETGSYLRMRDFTGVTGVTRLFHPGSGELNFGAFLEFGYGKYETNNTFEDHPNRIKGEGNTNYYGLGIMARYNFAHRPGGYPYVEGSLHGGRLENNFDRQTDFDDAFRGKTNYLGAHVGTGYIFFLGESHLLNVFGKFLWGYQRSDSVRLDSGDHIDFDSSHSTRVRVGARLSYTGFVDFSPFVGIGYRYTFNSKSRGYIAGMPIDVAEVKGGTGILETGITVHPSENLPLYFDFGFTGYVGGRHGARGNLSMWYLF